MKSVKLCPDCKKPLALSIKNRKTAGNAWEYYCKEHGVKQVD